jgi:hypothetical protein
MVVIILDGPILLMKIRMNRNKREKRKIKKMQGTRPVRIRNDECEKKWRSLYKTAGEALNPSPSGGNQKNLAAASAVGRSATADADCGSTSKRRLDGFAATTQHLTP